MNTDLATIVHQMENDSVMTPNKAADLINALSYKMWGDGKAMHDRIGQTMVPDPKRTEIETFLGDSYLPNAPFVSFSTLKRIANSAVFSLNMTRENIRAIRIMSAFGNQTAQSLAESFMFASKSKKAFAEELAYIADGLPDSAFEIPASGKLEDRPIIKIVRDLAISHKYPGNIDEFFVVKTAPSRSRKRATPATEDNVVHMEENYNV